MHNMLRHMRTTVDMPDGLLEEAKAVAERRKITLRDFMEEALRSSIEAERQRPAFRLQDGSFTGNGLQENLEWSEWSTMRALIYEGRGG
jgi:hypothetical protein